MRKLVLQMQLSLDGFVAASNGGLGWIFPNFDDQYTAWVVEMLSQAGTHIMGASTGRDMAAYWPFSKEPFAPPMNEIPKVIFSKTLDHLDWNNARIEKGDLAEEIARLKQQPGKDILAHGGARFARTLVKLALIDEYRLVIHPVALGSGLPLFSELSQPLNLELLQTIPFEKGSVAHIYRPGTA